MKISRLFLITLSIFITKNFDKQLMAKDKNVISYNDLKSGLVSKKFSKGILFIQKNEPTKDQLAAWSSYEVKAWIKEIENFEDGIYICDLQNNEPKMAKIIYIKNNVSTNNVPTQPICIGGS